MWPALNKQLSAMISSKLVLLLAGAALSVNAQSSAPAKATLIAFEGLPIDANSTATLVAQNSAATTYTFACPPVATGSALSSAKSAAGSAASSVGSAAGSLASSIGGAAGSLASSAANAGASAGSSIGNAIASDARSAISNIAMTPIPRPTNARRENVRLLPIAKPTKAARDLRLLPIAKPTAHARRQIPYGEDKDIECLPYVVVQGPETYAIKAEVTAPIKFSAEFKANWKGDLKSASEITGAYSMGGDVSELNHASTATGPASVLGSSVVVPLVTATASSSGSAGASGSPAANSNPAAAGPMPTGAVAYFGAAAGLLGAALAL
ncbi:hypothetical protein DM02DRAFT_632829 [Periconia macrospinosa]|uniref:Uncharacterized protein n=1 Tax=Periconia macrospinosa TaxID=97972 RepID=A0A2V1DED8_9PLEO|nr:hypothetical protein DM02DRAFT_632829 [Periconia macrospinosa]